MMNYFYKYGRREGSDEEERMEAKKEIFERDKPAV